jgi:2-polyprenyl-3-methyl-5-hydroxy-6-metoxy-1,4-benzoquinol methylase
MKFSTSVPERLTLGEAIDAQILRQHVARYEYVRKYVVGKRVLDVACGSGYGTAMLRDAGAKSVVGVDISASAVEHARKYFARDGVQFVVGTAEKLSTVGSFDAVISFETIEHLEHPESFFSELTHVLARNGTLIISTPVREYGALNDKPLNPFHVREWKSEEFHALLRMYFRNVEIYGQYNFKRWFPGSRTLQRFAFRGLHPSHFTSIDGFPVLSDPPHHTGFRFDMAVIVAKCQDLVK